MRIDYNLIQEVLTRIANEADGFSRNSVRRNDFPDGEEGDKNFYQVAYHYKVLCENGFVSGKVIESASNEGNYPVAVMWTGLTLSGQKILEAMENDTLWTKIKGNLSSVGVESLKQIPAFAIEILKGGIL